MKESMKELEERKRLMKARNKREKKAKKGEK